MPQVLDRGAPGCLRSTEERNALVEGHVRLVHHIVRRMARGVPPCVDIDDLIAAGFEGLLRAAERFDEERGVAFSTFAGCSIRGAVLDALREMDPLARPTRKRVNDLDRAEARLAGRFGGVVPQDELAREAGLTQREVEDALRVRRAATTVSIDVERAEGSLSHVLEDPRCADAIGRVLLQEAHDLVKEEIEHLLPNDRRVVLLYYADGMLFREIADILGVTEGRVSQIHKRAITRLRDAVKRRGLLD
jgi:RNA polymerase sigma factor for flagellar operon FliA